MNTKANIGKQLITDMLIQITQFRHLATKQQKLNKTANRYNHLHPTKQKQKCIYKNGLAVIVQADKMGSNKSCEHTRRSSPSIFKQSSTQKRLRLYQNKKQNQLKNPFVKIHRRRPQSAIDGKYSHQQQQQSRDRSPVKQNQRYQQLKKYYQNKYGGLDDRDVDDRHVGDDYADVGHQACNGRSLNMNKMGINQNQKFNRYINKQINQQIDLNQFANNHNRPASSRRSYFGKRKNN